MFVVYDVDKRPFLSNHALKNSLKTSELISFLPDAESKRIPAKLKYIGGESFCTFLFRTWMILLRSFVKSLFEMMFMNVRSILSHSSVGLSSVNLTRFW